MITQAPRKRVLEAERRYSGQEDAEVVVRWLNAHSRERAARRVASLISDLTDLCSSVQPWEERVPSSEEIARWKAARPRLNLAEAIKRGLVGEPRTWPTVNVGRDYSSKALRRAQATLARYSFRPFLVGQRAATGGRWVRVPVYARLYGEDIKPQFREANRAFSVSMSPSHSVGRGRYEESHAVLHIISLTRSGLIDRLRRCSCGTWFFAHNIRMWHHTARCRHHDYKSTEEWRKKRNSYMRDYYRRFQSRKPGAIVKRGK